MKEFMKDYKELCKQTGVFYMKHWKGTIILNAAIVAAEFGWFFRHQIGEKLDNKLNKNGEA